MTTHFPFSAETYRARRTQFINFVKSGKYLFLSNDEVAYNYTDNVFPYRQDSSFLYYFGLDFPGIYGIIDADAGTTTLFADDIDINMVIWTGPMPSMKSLAEKVGIDMVLKVEAFEKSVSSDIHFLPPYRAVHSILLSKMLGKDVHSITESASKTMIKAIIAQRSIKSAEELVLMNEATTISETMHLAVMKATKAGLKEYELVALASKIAREHGTVWSFPPIMTINGQTLHNHGHHNELTEDRILLFDGGCELPSGYAGDLTRAYPVSGKFTNKQKEVYEIVLGAQKTAIDLIKPGEAYLNCHLASAHYIFDGLKQLGITKGDSNEAVQVGAHALFFPHGLGHMIGLDVHDLENLGEDNVGYDETFSRSKQFGLRSLRMAKKLETGHVVTVEPGIYFIPELIALWKDEQKFSEFINYQTLESYLDFGGIRIEDDYAVVAGGSKKLGDVNLPKEIGDVESVMSM
ncbi:MAG: aminopeptidase P family protein [Saprospiraceae bacterium]|nr:aminopeptidase P family protein [Saprospiraceae bacterium]